MIVLYIKCPLQLTYYHFYHLLSSILSLSLSLSLSLNRDVAQLNRYPSTPSSVCSEENIQGKYINYVLSYGLNF